MSKIHPKRRSPHRRSGAFRGLEALESRRLMAIINVTAWGANGSDGNDDRAGIVNAINHSNDGDTIYFPAGTYRLSAPIASNSPDLTKPLGRRRIYQGETQIIANSNFDAAHPTIMNRTILLSTGADADQPGTKKNAIFNFRESNPNPSTFNVKFTNLTFQGRGLYLQNTTSGGAVEGVIVDNCYFDIRGRGHNCGIEWFTRVRNSSFTNNVFENGGENCIYGYDYDNLTIANNIMRAPLTTADGTITTINGAVPYGIEGMHVNPNGGVSTNLLIEQNYISGMHRMGIEYQYNGNNTIVQDNWYENPIISTTQSQNNDTFAYSIVADNSQGTITRRNTAIMPTNAASGDGIGVRIVFELGGHNLDCYNNYTIGGNHVVAVNGSNATGQVHDNHFEQYNQAPSNNGANHASATFSNNGPTVNVGFVPDLNFSRSVNLRWRPGPNWRYGDTVIQPPPDHVATPVNLNATPFNYFRIDLNWNDQADNETGYDVQISPDGVANWQDISGVLPANTSSYSVNGLTPATQYYFRVIAIGDGGTLFDSDPSNIAVATTKDPQQPLNPTDLVATSIGLNQVSLDWTDVADNEFGYRVYRLDDSGALILMADNLPAGTTHYSLQSLAGGQSYQFQVEAFNDKGAALSNIAAVETPVVDPAAVTTATPPTRRARTAFSFSGTSTTAITPPMGSSS